jgi:hypothetical protein
VRKAILISISAIALLVAIALAVFFFQNHTGEPIRNGTPYRDINAVIDQGLDGAQAKIRRTFVAPKVDQSKGKFAGFVLHAANDPIFPDDAQLQLASPKNPSLAAYVAVNPEARKWDFYLTPPVVGPADSSGNTDYYWTSEYQYRGQPVKFRSNFIIHLEPQSNMATRVSILEFQPEIWIGKEFDLLGHSGPGFYRDIRIVEPTNSDRADLLNFITQ